MTFYLIGALLSMAIAMVVVHKKRDFYLKHYTKPVLVVSMAVVTVLSWGFVLLVVYKSIKRERMYSKAKQLQKNREKDEKKLSKREKEAFIETIDNLSGGKCQLCKNFGTDEYHHSIFGNFGADKDDRSLMAICRGCHYLIHHSRSSGSREARQKAIAIGVKNWSVHNDEA